MFEKRNESGYVCQGTIIVKRKWTAGLFRGFYHEHNHPNSVF